ncbi:hypothetical protein H257_15448 [Aphanomyces astaci]|uniref:Uncharacterized protein n=1 Tax=Aphanomyces astaci TaxID=112090 RepID=W4FMA5_APHAT|nr:hypothetical protein H257_15448 [Aphanomyces astaci]ETV68642.1 hypothetical protein H257_15448 [Aphanomyces astaci]|eukprot:XP_009841867.1 hypothetical protein H257_15448 [Aphanomyces astaci]
MLQDARSSADYVASDDEPPTLNDIVARRKWTPGEAGKTVSVYNKSCIRNRPVVKDKMDYICGILDDNGSGVFVVHTSDVSLLGHYWTLHVFHGIALWRRKTLLV